MSRWSLVDEYVERYGSDRAAVAAFAADLMRGDPAVFKVGYTRENAVIATAEAFDLERSYVDGAVPR